MWLINFTVETKLRNEGILVSILTKHLRMSIQTYIKSKVVDFDYDPLESIYSNGPHYRDRNGPGAPAVWL